MALRLVESDSWLDRVAESFEKALKREDFSPDTVRMYCAGVKNFFNYLRDQGVDDLHHVNRELIEGWQDSLRERVPPLKATTRGLYSTSARRMLRWAAERDIVDWKLERAVVGVRTRHRNEQPRPIPADDLRILLDYLGPRHKMMTVVELRDRALFHFLLVTTARVREALQVQRGDYLRARIRQKGGSMHDLRAVPTVVAMIRDYLDVRTDELPCLWAAHGNNINAVKPLESPGVREAWTRLCAELGIQRFTTHQLRHTGMTALAEAQLPDRVLADRAGHADLRTAHRYTEVREGERQLADDAMEKLIAIGRPRLLPRIGRRGYGR